MPRRPAQRPEGKVIGDAAARDGRSARKLAAKAGISDSRWRHIVNGYQPVGQGQTIPIVAPPETLARMAIVVGVSSEQLDGAGRNDAAEELRDMLADAAHDHADNADDDEIAMIKNDPNISETERQELMEYVRERRRQLRKDLEMLLRRRTAG